MLVEIQRIKEEAKKEIAIAKDILSLENLERKYLGRKGLLRGILQKVSQLPEKERPKIGQLINQAKKEIESLIQNKKLVISHSPFAISDALDMSLPGEKFSYGHLHPFTQLKNEVAEIFQSMGFEILEGPEVDNEWYNFEALNIPQEHPARDMWDTFYIKNQKSNIKNQNLLLRTHTSNMQVRVMEKRKPPLRICVIGKCFRHEATDATHEHTLYQIEGYAVDKKICLANLIYTLKSFLNALYKKEVKIRIRPGYFPFVEPGLEIDMECANCASAAGIRRSFSKGGHQLGKDECPICKGSGWIEILGAGMIHPRVFESAGYPSGKYTGFAFGIGLDRLVMMRHKIDDIRWLHSGDLRFIRQF